MGRRKGAGREEFRSQAGDLPLLVALVTLGWWPSQLIATEKATPTEPGWTQKYEETKSQPGHLNRHKNTVLIYYQPAHNLMRKERCQHNLQNTQTQASGETDSGCIWKSSSHKSASPATGEEFKRRFESGLNRRGTAAPLFQFRLDIFWP